MDKMRSKTIKEKLVDARFDLLGTTIRRSEVEEIFDEAWNYFVFCGEALEDARMEVDNAKEVIRTLRMEQRSSHV